MKINNENKIFTTGFLDNSNLDDLKIHPALAPDDKTVEETLSFLRKENNEWVYVFDADEKKQIVRFKGEENYVNPPEEQFLRMKDKVILHNHPQDQSFSIQDINAITFYNAKKNIVVTPKYTYIAERNGKDWNIDLSSKEDSDLFEEASNWIISELNKKLLNNTETEDSINQKTNHLIWKNIFRIKNIKYERTNN